MTDDILARGKGSGDSERVDVLVRLEALVGSPSAIRVLAVLVNLEPDCRSARAPGRDVDAGGHLRHVGDSRAKMGLGPLGPGQLDL
jgi:hypothetical protein